MKRRPCKWLAVALTTAGLWLSGCGDSADMSGTSPQSSGASTASTAASSQVQRDLALSPSVSTYTWNFGANWGGGYANVGQADPVNPGNAVAGGDVWCPRTTQSNGALWSPAGSGANGVGDVMARAMAYSVKHPTKVYTGVGTLGGLGGSFDELDTTAGTLTKLSTTYGFGTSQAKNGLKSPASNSPRAMGQLIQVDYSSKTTEYVYALTNKGLVRAEDSGSGLKNFVILGPANNALTDSAKIPDMAWKVLQLVGSNTLIAASYGDWTNRVPTYWEITGIQNSDASTATITNITNTVTTNISHGIINDIRKVGTTYFAACGQDGVCSSSDGVHWKVVNASLFTNAAATTSAIAGSGQVLYVGTANFTNGGKNSVARSLDLGTTWEWVTTSAGAVDETVLNTSTTYWLTGVPGQKGLLAQDNYYISQIAIDEKNVGTVYLFGSAGCYVSTNANASKASSVVWRPAVVGLNGVENGCVLVGTSQGVVVNDTDWKAESSSDNFSSCQDDQTPPAFNSGGNHTVTIGSTTYKLTEPTNGNPADITVNGTSVASPYFQKAMTCFGDMNVDPKTGIIYVAQIGGGVLVGTP